MKNLSPIDENKDVVTKEYVDPIKSQAAINRTTLGTQCKNLLKNTAATTTINGVTFTVNDDKSVTLNGTSTAQADFYLRGAWGSTSEILQKNKYITSIGVSQSSTFNGVVMHCINNTTSIGSPSCNYPSLAVNSAITAVYISVSKGYTFSNYKLYPMIRYADILDDTYEPYQPSLIDRCLLKDTAGIALGVAQSGSITIDNLSFYTALWVNVTGNVSGINFKTNLIVPVAYLAKNTSNSVQLAGGIPSSAYITSEGVLAVKHMDGTITAKISGNTLDLTIGTGTIGSIEVVSLM